jgi:hypothetical protein
MWGGEVSSEVCLIWGGSGGARACLPYSWFRLLWREPRVAEVRNTASIGRCWGYEEFRGKLTLVNVSR